MCFYYFVIYPFVLWASVPIGSGKILAHVQRPGYIDGRSPADLTVCPSGARLLYAPKSSKEVTSQEKAT